jgi:hypothetical protein
VVSSVSPLRFFRIVTTQPSLIGWTFVAVVLVGLVAIVRDPLRSADAMVPVLLLQLFAVSSGFEVPARRGHYDLLLTSGHARVWMALVHWATSAAPGVVAWLVLAVGERAAGAEMHLNLLTSGTLTAMGLVSTLPWAINVRLPRFAGGIGWLLALAMSSHVLSSGGGPAGMAGPGVGQLVWPAWTVLVYPAGLVGRNLDVSQGVIAAPAIILAVGAMLAACLWVSRASVPLEAAQ